MLFTKKKDIRKVHRKDSYSQSGEDIIVKYIFKNIGIKNPGYIDVGAHHPYFLNNTALFYESGSSGINIEPDTELFAEIKKYRPRDINLNIGIGKEENVLDFYLISSPTLNTFSKAEAESYKKEGNYTIRGIKKVKVTTIQNVLKEYANNKFPEFLSIDAEGVDELILHSINFKENYPIVICIETISFSASGNGIKNNNIINFLQSVGYLLYADTNINSIFVKESIWKR